MDEETTEHISDTILTYRCEKRQSKIDIKTPLEQVKRNYGKTIEGMAGGDLLWAGLDGALARTQRFIHSKPIYSLETVEDKIEACKIDVDSEHNNPTNFCFTNEHYLELIDAVQWSNQDSVSECIKDVPEEVMTLGIKRNEKMAAVIFEKLSLGESSLFAAGAAHFVGNKSIVSLLQQQGVQVVRKQLEESAV